eukprot:6409961-Pyramimonas_sp.AAC.1
MTPAGSQRPRGQQFRRTSRWHYSKELSNQSLGKSKVGGAGEDKTKIHSPVSCGSLRLESRRHAGDLLCGSAQKVVDESPGSARVDRIQLQSDGG